MFLTYYYVYLMSKYHCTCVPCVLSCVLFQLRILAPEALEVQTQRRPCIQLE